VWVKLTPIEAAERSLRKKMYFSELLGGSQPVAQCVMAADQAGSLTAWKSASIDNYLKR
jgi:hypothetical protein